MTHLDDCPYWDPDTTLKVCTCPADDDFMACERWRADIQKHLETCTGGKHCTRNILVELLCLNEWLEEQR